MRRLSWNLQLLWCCEIYSFATTQTTFDICGIFIYCFKINISRRMMYRIIRIAIQLFLLIASHSLALYFSVSPPSYSLHRADIGCIYFVIIAVSVFTLGQFPDFDHTRYNKEFRVRKSTIFVFQIILLASLSFFHGTSYWATLMCLSPPLWHWYVSWIISGFVHLFMLNKLMCIHNSFTPYPKDVRPSGKGECPCSDSLNDTESIGFESEDGKQ